MGAAGEMVSLPAEVIAGVDELVGTEQRDGFVAEVVARAVQAALNRRQIRKLLEKESPIWKEENHPELAGGIAGYVHRMRRAEGLRRDEALASDRDRSV